MIIVLQIHKVSAIMSNKREQKSVHPFHVAIDKVHSGEE